MSAKNNSLGMQHLTVVPTNFEPETAETPQAGSELSVDEDKES